MDNGAPDHNLERYAKSQGFRDYATMAAFYRNKSQRQAEPQASQGGLSASIPMMHPSKLFEYVLEKYRNAVGER